jgi:hypothetical protein
MAKKQNSKKIPALIVAAVLVLAGFGYGTWRILQLRSEISTAYASLGQTEEELTALKRDIVTNPADAVTKLQEEQNAALLDEISQVYTIPEGETPTIATVQDVSKLADQPFFEGAENGDMLVVFDKSGQAVLYRPSTQRIVKVGPVNIEPNSDGVSNTQTEE